MKPSGGDGLVGGWSAGLGGRPWAVSRLARRFRPKEFFVQNRYRVQTHLKLRPKIVPTEIVKYVSSRPTK